MEEKPTRVGNRGLDGLTSEELLATRQGFWDEAFTQVLLRCVPDGTKTIVDIGCGLAPAAHALLPRLHAVNYVGVDADEQRLQEAGNLMTGATYASRVELRVGRAEKLPFPDAQTPFVLTCMTLQHLTNPAEAVQQIGRILAPRGRVVAVEPDNLSNLFYFDANLEEVNLAFRELFTRLRRERSPADSAIGPALAKLFERENFLIIEFFPYVVGRAKKLMARQSFDRARQIVKIISSSLPSVGIEVTACNSALDRAEASAGPLTWGYYCQVVPLFVCVAEKL